MSDAEFDAQQARLHQALQDGDDLAAMTAAQRMANAGHAARAEELTAEIERLRAQLPPADLPATLATVDDVATVCVAAGLVRTGPRWSYLDDQVHVGIVNGEIGWQVVRRDGCGGQLVCEASDWIPLSGRMLWDAIQAARSAS